ncbi:hypothetical protein OAJ54_00180 [Marine Group III euryarchaeote]|nr:hypothetical protein [Marine Group III euryarchaeote]
MSRNTLFTAGIILLVLSLFLPWFTLTFSNDYMVRDNLYEDGKKINSELSGHEKYYLDHSNDESTWDTTKNGKTDSQYYGNYSYYRESMETNGDIASLPGFLYSIYKIILVVIALSFIVVAFEAFSANDALQSMKLGITLLLTIIILVFITGVKGSYLADRGDPVMIASYNSNEYVNMTSPIGFNEITVNDTFTQYYELTNFSYEKIILTIPDYDNTWDGSWFSIRAGPGLDDLEWDREYNSSSDLYYIWFLKSETNNSDNSDPNRAGTGIMVDISDLSDETEDSSDIIKNRIIQAMMNNAATTFSVSSEPSEQLWSKMSIEMSDYGATDGFYDWSWGGSWDTIVQGSTTYEAVEGDFNVSVNWYPSVGFFVTVISLLSFSGSIFREYF